MPKLTQGKLSALRRARSQPRSARRRRRHYTAAQRAALLQLAWDHVGSALDHREHVFELHANGGTSTWRGRLRRRFDRYNELANAVTRHTGMSMPEVKLDSIRDAPLAARRPVTPGGPPKPR